MYYLDPSIFGYANWGMPYNPSRHFVANPSDVGRGFYTPYNVTGPTGINVTFHWTGAVYAQFREAWETNDQLGFGALWFEMDVPINDSPDTFELRRVHPLQPFDARLEGHNRWLVTMSLDIDESPALEHMNG